MLTFIATCPILFFSVGHDGRMNKVSLASVLLLLGGRLGRLGRLGRQGRVGGLIEPGELRFYSPLAYSIVGLFY